MITEDIRIIGKGKQQKAVHMYLVDYTGYETGEDLLVLGFILVTRLERKVEINCDNKVIECMSMADAKKVEEIVL